MEKEGDLHHSFLQGCGQITNGLTNRSAEGGSAPENSQVGRLPLLRCNMGLSILCLLPMFSMLSGVIPDICQCWYFGKQVKGNQ